MQNVLIKHLGLPRIKGAERFVFAVLVDALGTGLFLPFSLLYFNVAAGLPLPTVGLVLSIVTIFSLPMNPLTGTLVDRFGARRVVIASQLLQGSGFFGYLVVNSVPLLIATTLLVTIGVRTFWSSYFSLIADIATPEDRDRWYGLAGALQNAGVGIGGLLAGLLVATSGVLGYHLIVAANGASFFIAAAFLLPGAREPHHQHAAREETQGYRAVLQDRPFLILIAANIVFALCILLLSVGLPVYATETLKTPIWLIGVLFALNTALIATTQTIAVRLLEPYRRTRVLVLAGFLWGAWSALLALAILIPSAFLVPYLFVVTGLFTLAELMNAPTSNALVAEISPQSLRGRYLAAFQFSWGIAATLAPAVFTLLFTIRPALPWIVAAILALIAGLTVYRLEPHLPRRAVHRSETTRPTSTITPSEDEQHTL